MILDRTDLILRRQARYNASVGLAIEDENNHAIKMQRVHIRQMYFLGIIKEFENLNKINEACKEESS